MYQEAIFVVLAILFGIITLPFLVGAVVNRVTFLFSKDATPGPKWGVSGMFTLFFGFITLFFLAVYLLINGYLQDIFDELWKAFYDWACRLID
jgi:hypothetical protein